MKFLAPLVAFLFLLTPSLWFTWHNQDDPRFGDFGDDGLYLTSAKTLFDGVGYRIPSLPGEPAQTKYPPGYPALLAAAWADGATFPDNLKQAVWVQWRMLPVLLLLAMLYWQRLGFTSKWQWGLAALLAMNPYVIFFSVMLMSEIPFTVFLLAVFIALSTAENGGRKWLAIAGITAGLAFLFRTAGVALLISVPAVLLLRRRFNAAAIFFVTMVPAVVAWAVWSKQHMGAGTDLITLYYTNYAGFHWLNFHWNELHLFLWKNIDSLLYGIGALVLPKVSEALPMKILTQLLAIATLRGCWKLSKEKSQWQYAAFGAVFLAMFAIWSFPPNERFVLPLAPLLLAGFCVEMKELVGNIRKGFHHKDSSQRVAAKIMAGAVSALFAGCLMAQLFTTFNLLPRMMDEFRQRLERNKPAFAWVKNNLPADARILAEQDTLVYLYTGRKSANLIIPTVHMYRDEPKQILAAYSDAVNYARKQNLNYLYLTKDDFRRDLDLEDYQKIQKSLENPIGVAKVYDQGGIRIFKLN